MKQNTDQNFTDTPTTIVVYNHMDFHPATAPRFELFSVSDDIYHTILFWFQPYYFLRFKKAFSRQN